MAQEQTEELIHALQKLAVEKGEDTLHILVIGNGIPPSIERRKEHDKRIGFITIVAPEKTPYIRNLIILSSTDIIIDAIGLSLPWSISENLSAYYVDLLEIQEADGEITEYKWERMLAGATSHRYKQLLKREQEQEQRRVAEALLNTFRHEPEMAECADEAA